MPKASPVSLWLTLPFLLLLAVATPPHALAAEAATAEKPAADETEKAGDAAPDASKDADEPQQETEPAKPAAKAKAKQKRAAKPEKEPEPQKARYAEFRISGPLPESPGGAGPFGDLQVDLRKLIARIDRAAEDDEVDGLVLRMRETGMGRGQRHELREAIKRFRAAGKPAVAELEVATGATYLVAVACDEIVMPESGFITLDGVRAEPLFFKGMLAKIGVKADFVHVGEAKGAGEQFTRRRWSEPVKENLTSLIDDLYEQMVDRITMERPMNRQAVVDAIDTGLLTATEAKRRGLVDRLAYADDLRATLAGRHEADELVYLRNYGKKKVDTDFSGPAGFFKLLGMIAGGSKKGARGGDKIAVVYAVGPIMTGKSEVDPFGQSDSVGSTTIVEALGEAADDERTAAIVLRVVSPGGSAVASDLIWNKIRQIEKPVVVSMGDVAASGGYYISMGADRIYAEPTTVTGSIGVVSGKFAIKGMLKKLDITSDLINRGANSGMFSAMKKFSPSEREALVALMEDCYDQFTAKAAAGRGLSQSRIKELGGGKVYTGRQAERLGLIDELGDLSAAIDGAKELAGIDADTKVKIQTYPEAVDFFQSLFGDTDAQREVSVRVDLGGALPELDAAIERLARLRKLFAREPVAVIMPFELNLE